MALSPPVKAGMSPSPILSAETPHLLNQHRLQQSSLSSILDGDDTGGGDDDDDLFRLVMIWQQNKF